MKHRKPNKTMTFIKNAVAGKTTYRDVLKGYHVREDCVIAADGYVMHVDYTPDDTVTKVLGNHGINIHTYEIKDVKYPDVDFIINDKPEAITFSCSPAEFINALKICKVFVNSSDEDKVVITSNTDDNTITLYSEGDNGNTTVTINGEVSQNFIARYKISNLYKAVTCMKLEKINFYSKQGEDYTPLYMLAENALYKRMAVVMPLTK